MDLILTCDECNQKSEYPSSIEAWDKGWNLDGKKVCPGCVIKQNLAALEKKIIHGPTEPEKAA